MRQHVRRIRAFDDNTGYARWQKRTQSRWDEFWAHPKALQMIFDFLRGKANYAQLSELHCETCKEMTCTYVVNQRRERYMTG